MNIRQLREKAKLTREEAAPKIGVSLSTLARWEGNETSSLSDIANAIEAISKTYKVSESEVLKALKQLKKGA